MMETLVDLAKAFAGGDDSAFDPLIDYLLENGYPHTAQRIWHQFKFAGKDRSAFLHYVCEGRPKEVEELMKIPTYRTYYGSETIERFKGTMV